MSASTVIVCPGCQKPLKIREEIIGKSVRCKRCGKVIATGQTAGSGSSAKQSKLAETSGPAAGSTPKAPFATKSAAPPSPMDVSATAPAAPPPQPADPGAPLSARKRIKPKLLMPALFVVITLLGLVGLFFLFREDLTGVVQEVRQNLTPTQPSTAAPPTSLLVQANPTNQPSSAETKPTRPRPSAAQKPQNAYRGRIASPYPARTLLIGVKNYLYLNPINPGYREEGKARDLLGLGALGRALVEEHGYPKDQVLELSDVAIKNPIAPTKATIEATLDDFLAKARPQDHAIVVFVGYAAAKADKVYLVPLDGDPERTESLIPVAALLDKLKNSPAHHKLLIADLSPIDPEQYPIRPLPAPVPEKALAEFTKLPEGVQVWLSASPGQTAHQFASGGYAGSVFMHQLGKSADIRQAENWSLVEKQQAAKNPALPLMHLANSASEATTKAVADKNKAKQTPILYGTPGKPPAVVDVNAPPAPAVVIKAPASDELTLVNGILRELPLSNDPAREVRLAFLPAFDPKVLVKYAPDQKTDFRALEDLKSQVIGKPLRLVTVEAVLQLEKKDYRLRMKYQFNANDQQFKRMLESEQQRPASLASDLIDLYEQLKQANEKRKEELSPRWQAHFDYVTARVLAKLISIQEYNFVLGNNLRKDSPVLKEPAKNNGWAIIPQDKLQQTETRNYDKERKKILEKIIKEHPGTPWEVLARREQATPLGLKLVEARVER